VVVKAMWAMHEAMQLTGVIHAAPCSCGLEGVHLYPLILKLRRINMKKQL
jgi:hypothetical protein